jgi:CMP/dCMP kinase
MKKRIITLGGMPGSGKSSTAKNLAAELGYRHFSSGDFLRQVAEKHGWSIDELIRAAEKDPQFDHEVDELIRQASMEENLVIDSRLAFHWIPESYKVFLNLDPHVAAERTFAQIKTEGRVGQQAESVQAIFTNLLSRIEIDKNRYFHYYGLDYLDESHYNLVVDTADHPLEEVAKIVLEKYRAWLT